MFQETNIVLKVTNFSWRMFKCKEAMCYRSFPGGTVVEETQKTQETQVRFLGGEGPLE